MVHKVQQTRVVQQLQFIEGVEDIPTVHGDRCRQGRPGRGHQPGQLMEEDDEHLHRTWCDVAEDAFTSEYGATDVSQHRFGR